MRHLSRTVAAVLIAIAGTDAAAQDTDSIGSDIGRAVGASGLGVAAGPSTALYRDGLPDIGSRNLVLTDRGLSFNVGRTDQQLLLDIDRGDVAVRLSPPDRQAGIATGSQPSAGNLAVQAGGLGGEPFASGEPDRSEEARPSSVLDGLGSFGDPSAPPASVVDDWTNILETLSGAR